MLNRKDIVKVVNNVYTNEINNAVRKMQAYKGITAVIVDIVGEHFYNIDIDGGNFAWHRTLLIPRRKLPKGSLVKVVPFVCDNNNGAAGPMTAGIDNVFTVKSYVGEDYYLLEEDMDEWSWHATLLDPLNKAKCDNPFLPKHFIPKPGTRFADY